MKRATLPAPLAGKRTLALAVGLSAHSAFSGAATLALEEVVITAQKREESLQQTPISITALGAEELQNRGIQSLVDLRTAVPNLEMTPHPNSGTTALVFMRGIGNRDDQITQDPSVAIYLDGVYVARSQGLAMEVADLARVEVLQGPQGSLYGRNATGGAISFHTRRPEIGEFGFKQDLSAGDYNLLRSRTQLNLPLGDNAAAQLAYLNTRKDGFIDNTGSGARRFGDHDREAMRLALLWSPSDQLDVFYSYDRSALEDTPVWAARVGLYPEVSPRPERAAAADVDSNDVVAQGHNLTLEWALSDQLLLKSITGYREVDSLTNQRFHPGLFAPDPVFFTVYDTQQEQFSQELQLIGESAGGSLEYVLGAFYFDEEADNYDLSDPLGPGFTDRFTGIDNRAWAVFGQTTWTPDAWSRRLHLTAGLRWSRDERRAELYSEQVAADGSRSPSPRSVGDRDFSNLSPSLIAAWDIEDDIHVYAKVVSGYKTGGYNIRASSLERFAEGFDEEELTSWELGLKSEWWDSRLRLNAALFRADYEDIQLSITPDPALPNIADVFNAGEATIDGLEMALTALPLPPLSIDLRYAYLDAGYDEVRNPGTGLDEADRFFFVEAPQHSLNASLRWDFPLTPLGAPALLIDYSWQDEKITATNDPRYRMDDYGLLNLRLNLEDIPVPRGDLRLGLWGRNLDDTDYYVAHFTTGVPTAIYGEPRSWGIDLSYSY